MCLQYVSIEITPEKTLHILNFLQIVFKILTSYCMRIIIELGHHVNPNIVLNQLYKHTYLQSTFGIILLALVDGVPRTLNLKQCLEHYLDHRRVIVHRRTEYELAEARKRHHLVEGLLKAIDVLDEVITLIRASKNPDEAKKGLVEKFKFTEVQAKAILDMRLAKLTALERESLENEYPYDSLLIHY